MTPFDLALLGLAAAIVALASAAGGVASLAALITLPVAMLGAVHAGFSPAGVPPTLAAVAAWQVLLVTFVLLRRMGGRRPDMAGRLTGAAAGLVQAAFVAIMLSGALLGSSPEDTTQQAGTVRGDALRPALAAAGASATGRDAVLHPASAADREPSRAGAPPRPLDWAVAQPWRGGAVRHLPGRLDTAERAPLAFEVGGQVKTVAVTIGDRFARGDVLATLDTTQLGHALEERRAALREAEARLAEARQNFERKRALHESGVVSEAAFEAALSALKTAESRAEAAREGVAQARDRLADAALKAPYDGLVAQRMIEPAQSVQPGEPAFEIQSSGGGFEIHASVPETLVARLSTGATHEARLLDGSDRRFEARLTRIGARATGRGGFPVTLAVSGRTTGLRAGMSVEIAFRLDPAPAQNLVAIPLAALASTEDGHAVWRIDAGGHVRHHPVTLARIEGDTALVADGLSPGARVATRGLDLLTDGQAVAPRGIGIARFDD